MKKNLFHMFAPLSALSLKVKTPFSIFKGELFLMQLVPPSTGSNLSALRIFFGDCVSCKLDTF